MEDDVLVGKGNRQPVTGDLVAQAYREERLPLGEQLVDGPAERGDLGMVAISWVTRSWADDHQIVAVQRAWCVRLVPHHRRGHSHDQQHMLEHVDEVVLAVEDHRGLALELGQGRCAALVVEPESRKPLIAPAQCETHVLVGGQVDRAFGRDRCALDQPERSENPPAFA